MPNIINILLKKGLFQSQKRSLKKEPKQTLKVEPEFVLFYEGQNNSF